MNKKAILIIIGLMSAALIGIITLQAYWINWSISLEEKRFDKDVFSALNIVSEKLQRFEEVEKSLEALIYIPSLQNQFLSQHVHQPIDAAPEMPPIEFFINQDVNIDSLLSINNIFAFIHNQDTCNCVKCVRERDLRSQRLWNYWQQRKVTQIVNPPPIEQRIDLPLLDKSVKQELLSRGINTKFNYGIFSNQKNTFVIRDGHFVVEEEEQLQASQAASDQLTASKYNVRLFPTDLRSPGILMLHFPSKASVVWRSGWRPLLASIIFTGIILFCFAYTIQVIFRQKKLSEMKTDFINNMTHEFKTPIATISLAADSISSPMVVENPSRLKRFAEIIRQENSRMHEQVERVLQMAQIERQNFNLKLGSVDVHDLIENAVENVNLQVEKKDGHIFTDFRAEHAVIQADATHFSNIIHNLLDNANKYSPEKPEIAVHTRNTPQGIEVVVEDKGIGMSKEARKHIFDRFYRVHTGNLHDVKGFGLGLSYVKAMMDAHKGSIDVKSEPGKGSSFILRFPFYQ
jgi:two-component system phosphate regulon sensor histidine kinase PhoR